MRKIWYVLTVLFVAVLLVCASQWKKTEDKLRELIIYEEEIKIPGLTDSFEMVFVADTHVALCDERDETFREYMATRYEMFRNTQGNGAEESFENIILYLSKNTPDLLVFGGDIVDAATASCIEYMETMIKKVKCPWIYGMGNHDFNYGAQEYYSDKAFKELLPKFENLSKTQNGFQYTEYDEFIIFVADDINNQVSAEAANGLADICKIGKPIILVSHVPIEPLEENTLFQETNRVWGADENGYSRVLLGEHSKRPNEHTKKFLDLILDENSPVELVLSGHIHFYHKDYLKDDLLQIVTGPGYQQELVKIKLIPQEQ